MGTRSNIIIHMRNGLWKRIYCHWDGYLSHNGRILQDHYKTQAKVERLAKLGNLSILGPEIGRKHAFGTPRTGKGEHMCLAYGRDRGEKDQQAETFETLAAAWPGDDSWVEYVYFWTGGEWFVARGTGPEAFAQHMRLADALLADAAPTA